MSNSAGDVVASKRRDLCKIDSDYGLFGETLAAALGTYWRHDVCLHYRDGAAHTLSPPLRADPSTPKHLLALLAT